jgi:hypothetical protein
MPTIRSLRCAGLSQVRRARADASIVEEDGRLSLVSDWRRRPRRGGGVDHATVDDVARGDLLEDPTSSAVEFARWSVSGRAATASGAAPVMRCHARAHRTAARFGSPSARSPPSHSTTRSTSSSSNAISRGDLSRASEYVAATEVLYQREAGVAAPRLRRALERRGHLAAAPRLTSGACAAGHGAPHRRRCVG